MSFTNRYIVSVPFIMLTYYSQITRQRAVLKFKLHLLKLWFRIHALIVLYKGFTDFTLLLTIVLYPGFKMIVIYGTHAQRLARQGL